MLAAVDSCFGLIGPHQHGTANKQAQIPTENTKWMWSGGLNALFSGCAITSTHVQHSYILYFSHIPQA